MLFEAPQTKFVPTSGDNHSFKWHMKGAISALISIVFRISIAGAAIFGGYGCVSTAVFFSCHWCFDRCQIDRLEERLVTNRTTLVIAMIGSVSFVVLRCHYGCHCSIESWMQRLSSGMACFRKGACSQADNFSELLWCEDYARKDNSKLTFESRREPHSALPSEMIHS